MAMNVKEVLEAMEKRTVLHVIVNIPNSPDPEDRVFRVDSGPIQSVHCFDECDSLGEWTVNLFADDLDYDAPIDEIFIDKGEAETRCVAVNKRIEVREKSVDRTGLYRLR